VMTDNENDDIEEDKKSILESMQGNKVCSFQTSDDCLILRSNEVSAVLILRDKPKGRRTKLNKEIVENEKEDEVLPKIIPEIELDEEQLGEEPEIENEESPLEGYKVPEEE
jgi:hypothetical protein